MARMTKNTKKETKVCVSELIVILSSDAARSSYNFDCIKDNLDGYTRLLNVADEKDVFHYDVSLLRTPATEKLIFSTMLHGKECHRNITIRKRETSWQDGFAIFSSKNECIISHKR